MIYVAISLCVAAICNLPRVLRQVWPHITVLVAFAGFVVWNGGVVLGGFTSPPVSLLDVADLSNQGDKSNHIATIHLAQMLYIWAFFSFFSLPLLVPYALPIVNSLFRMTRFVLSIPDRTVVNPAASKSRKTKKSDGKPGVQGRPSWRLSQIYFFYFSELVTTLYYICTLVLSAVIIKLNTIIHPFTLADNRHYMFYVFRYTIRRAPWIRYSLIVIYSIGRWLIWDTLAGCRASTRPEYAGICSKYYYLADNPSPYTNHPLFLSGRGRARQVDDRYPAEASKTSAALSSPAQSAEDVALEQDPLRQSVEPVSVSTGLIFLLATSLSLVTAPLVEPRYFIVPWVMWRLLIPAWRLHDHDPEQGVLSYMRPDSSFGKPVKSLQRYDVRLILETVWFLAINAFTGYIFLFKPYIWKAEDGTVLDGGRLQRFLW
jgi:alpha-1,2-glucosyltransferase